MAFGALIATMKGAGQGRVEPSPGWEDVLLVIFDWIEAVLVPCPHWAREMGYRREARAITACYRQCGDAWAHLKRTQEVIMAALAQCASRRKAVIFGSGMLFDVPIAELAAAFRQVILVDIVHPLATCWRLWQWKNVRRLSADITGVAEEVFHLARCPEKPLPR